MRYQGKRALVTGAGGGIGRAVALRLAAEGAHVVCHDIIAATVDVTAKTINECGGAATAVVGDLRVDGDVDRLVAGLAPAGVDVLVNVAGIADHLLPLGETDDEMWNNVISINLTGLARLTRGVLEGMVERESGSIVSIGSVASFSGGGAGAAYTASKHALHGLTRSIAFFYGPRGIRCNVVAPGPVTTDLSGTANPTVEWAWKLIEPQLGRSRRFATAEDIASVVSWVGSDEASIINGVLIPADAGWSAS